MAKKLLKRTASLCPECLKTIPAEIFERAGKVYISKKCPKHGSVEEIYWGDAKLYHKAESFARDGIGVSNPQIKKKAIQCPRDCGLCSIHKSHTALSNIAVTNRCDLSCWYCLPRNEEIVAKIDGSITVVKIGRLVDNWLSKNSERIGDAGEFSVPEKIEVLTMDGNKTKWTRVMKLFRRKYCGRFIRIKTESGKEITTTADHRFVVKSSNGTIKKLPEVGAILFSLAEFQGGNGFEIDLLEGFRNLPEKEMKSIYVRNISEFFSQIDGRVSDFSKRFSFKEQSMYSWRHRNSMPLDQFYAFIDKSKIKPNGVAFGVDGKAYNFGRKLKITPALAKLIGYFVTDGHYSKQNIWFTCGDEYVKKDIESCLKEIGLTYSVIKVKDKAPQINVGNKILSIVFMYALGIPAGAHSKRLPRNFASFDEKSRLAMLEGMLNGDGYVVRGENCASIGMGSVSRGLIVDTSRLLSTLSMKSRNHRMSMKNNPLSDTDILYKLYIAGKEMLSIMDNLNLKPSHMKRLKNLSLRRGSKLIVDGNFISDKIKSIEWFEDKEQFVYDLEVADDSHSFIAGDGILVSNCFFYAKRMGYVYEPTKAQIRQMMKNLRGEKPVPNNALQLTGGEPTLRKDIVDIIKMAKKEGFDHVQLNTNGIRLSQDLELVKQVRKAGVNTLYLSYDGMTAKTNPKNYWEIPGVMENCRKADIGIVLVPTIIRGVNDHELGDMIKFGFRNIDVIRSVNFQPVSLVGKISKADRKKLRITIPDAIKNIEKQTQGEIGREDFYPVPTIMPVTRFVEALTNKPEYALTSHFACGMATYVFNVNGKLTPITRFVDVEGLLNYLDEKADQLEQSKANRYVTGLKLLWKIGSFIDKKKAPRGFSLAKIIYNALIRHDYNALGKFHYKSLFIGMMHFMDLYNYDIERVKRCCIHYAMTDNRIIPFCAFNVIPQWYRDKSQKSQGISFSEWEKKTGRKLKNDAYRRDVKALASTQAYRKVYKDSGG